VAEGIAGSGAAQGRHCRALRFKRDEACPGSRNKDAVDPGLAGLLLTCAGKNRQRFVFLGRIEEKLLSGKSVLRTREEFRLAVEKEG
jgi:hypothetical protein